MAVNPLKGKTLEQIAQMAAAKGASQSQIQAGYNAVSAMKQSQPVNAPTSMPVNAPATMPINAPQSTPMATPGFANPFSSGEDGDIAMAGRKAPTVATPTQPVVSKTYTNDLAYDPNNPEDYLMKLTARGNATGKKPSEQEYYNAMLAQRALQSRQTQANPLQSELDRLMAEQERMKGEEKTRDTDELEAYKRQLEAQYGLKRDELLESGKRQQGAAQGVFSFSGFGRSTAAADKMVQIQKDTDNAINSLNAAMQAEIMRKQAELEGADSETLAAINEQISQYRAAATNRQIEALKATQEANKSTGASYIDAINNLITAANKSGIQLGDAKNIQEMATLARNADGSINEDFVASLPEDLQAIIRSAAMTSGGGTGEAAKTISIGSGRNEKVYQRNPETNRYDIPVGGSGFGGGGGGGGGFGGGATTPQDAQQLELVNRLTRIKEAVNNSNLPRASILLDPEFKADLAYLKANMTFEKLNQMRAAGVKLGVLSDSDMRVLGEAALTLTPGMKKESIVREVDRLIAGLGVNIPTTTQTTSSTNTSLNADKVRNFSTEAKKQGATDAEIKAYIAANPAQFR